MQGYDGDDMSDEIRYHSEKARVKKMKEDAKLKRMIIILVAIIVIVLLIFVFLKKVSNIVNDIKTGIISMGAEDEPIESPAAKIDDILLPRGKDGDMSPLYISSEGTNDSPTAMIDKVMSGSSSYAIDNNDYKMSNLTTEMMTSLFSCYYENNKAFLKGRADGTESMASVLSNINPRDSSERRCNPNVNIVCETSLLIMVYNMNCKFCNDLLPLLNKASCDIYKSSKFKKMKLKICTVLDTNMPLHLVPAISQRFSTVPCFILYNASNGSVELFKEMTLSNVDAQVNRLYEYVQK